MTEEQRARHKARCAVYYAANKARQIALQMARRKANPEERKAHDAAYRARNAKKVSESKERYRLANLEKVREAKARWRRENPEKMRSARIAWQKQNPDKKQVYRENRRAVERGAAGKLSPGIAERLYAQQIGACNACRVQLCGKYEIDHILPLALGGSHADENLQLLCRTCNRRKGKKHPDVFAREVSLCSR